MPMRPLVAAFARFAAAAAALLVAGPAGAVDPAPPSVADLSSARSVAVAGGRGLAGGTESIFLNAAALAARKSYSVETQWLLERAGSVNTGQWLTLAAIDSEASAVAGGFAYTRLLSGPTDGNALHGALAFPIVEGLYAGVTGKYLSLGGAEPSKAATVDASLFLKLGRFLSIGGAGYNLVNVYHPTQAPRAYGVGVAIGDDRTFHVTGDWRRDTERPLEVGGARRRSDAWGIGGEYLAGNKIPLRAGYLKDDTRGVRYWSAGAGLVTASGAAIDATYRQSLDDSSDRTFAAALKIFFLAG